jgi:hypothetical protein
MRTAYVHILPLEYYPPARNSLTVLKRRTGWEVKAWSSDNRKGLLPWTHPGVEVRRPRHSSPKSSTILRMVQYLGWHLRTAVDLSKWKPDVVMSVEPHSGFAVWLYFTIFRGKARLFIHHHEYYAREDFEGTGMRLLKRLGGLERRDLFPRAEWVSQTNANRLEMLREWNPQVQEGAAAIFPNYPPVEWFRNAVKQRERQEASAGPLRLVYVGSASFRDTFIREVVEWVAEFPDSMSLHVCGHNIHGDVWAWLEEMAYGNVTLDRGGVDYEGLPELLSSFDVGLVLYKGNTLNFVYNVPNKAIEYLVCGLEVWYPGEMEGMRIFHRENGSRKLREMNFGRLPSNIPERLSADGMPLEWTCERAMEPLIEKIMNSGRKDG